ncbi:metallo-beta-lactamase family protein [Thermotomaculum hydrothermale]|uniref:Metallo-beta-lactamase family protein n=1 Tax=Thermotomaculum hydrothermale TaxID=981385 RepID=A0A7R6SZV4_9BACT|nr:MBL fold metallo-hydrolase [Thermotomaculum hydrothermale]BBB33180.1 metallo-beta-lactamase family protein [Thermotomaculum hydrothermale]
MSEYSFIIHEIKGYISSLFLIETNGKFLLLDAGCSCDFKKVKSFLEERGKSLNDLKLVVVTHMHPDHAGAVKYFKKNNIPIASTEGAYRWYRGLGGFIQHKIDTFLAQFSARRKKNILEPVNYKRKFIPDYLLKDGDTLPFFPDWKVVFTPGHTLYDISLFNEKGKVFYLADLILKMGDKYVLPFPIIFPDLMKKSLDRIKEYNFDTLLLAHGGLLKERGLSQNFSKVIDSLKETIGKIDKIEFKIFYPFCLFVHDKWVCKIKQCR